MEYLLKQIGNLKLEKIAGSLHHGNTKQFKEIQKQFPDYDADFLWIVCYQHENIPFIIKYIVANYKKFHQILDSRFLKKLCTKGKFQSHMWEMILCDILSSSGKLIPKEKSGADFLLELKNGEEIQIEAVAPDESNDKKLRSVKPDYSTNNFFELSGNIEDIERPILLRVMQGVNDKKDDYDNNKPLIIAVNSHKAVGLISRDDYVLRRILFGLGSETITRNHDGSYKHGLEQNPLLNKPQGTSFPVALFNSPEYQHISGIIYTSQSPLGLVPGGFGWHNYGITYVPNPNTNYKAEVLFPYFRRIECNKEIYQQIDAQSEFKSSVSFL